MYRMNNPILITSLLKKVRMLCALQFLRLREIGKFQKAVSQILGVAIVGQNGRDFSELHVLQTKKLEI